jgi:hypothetical protein
MPRSVLQREECIPPGERFYGRVRGVVRFGYGKDGASLDHHEVVGYPTTHREELLTESRVPRKNQWRRFRAGRAAARVGAIQNTAVGRSEEESLLIGARKGPR